MAGLYSPEFRTRFAWWPVRLWGLDPDGRMWARPLLKRAWLKPVREMKAHPVGHLWQGRGVWTAYQKHQKPASILWQDMRKATR